MLGGILENRGNGRRAGEWLDGKIDECRPQLENYEALCKDLGEPPANVALAWLLNNPAVTAPIIGPRTMDQLTGALQVPELKLSNETVKNLDRIWPGPGGEAPNAYAW